MATVARTTIGKPSSTKPGLAKIEPLAVKLPTVVSKIHTDPSDFHILIHGDKKIGKTTLAMMEPNTLLLTFDPLQKSQAILQAHCPDWKHFEAYLKELEKLAASGKFSYKRVVLDGADIWYRACQEHTCKLLGISHPSEEDWGKGWDKLKQTFEKAVDRLLALPCGVWFICHSDWKDVETRRKGVTVSKLAPLLKAGGEEILVGKIDGWFAYTYDEDERVLVVKGDERTASGHRIKHQFLTPGGRMVCEIPMGSSEEDAWKNFLEAFNNKQRFVTLNERDNPPQKKGAPAPVSKPLPKAK